MKASRIAAIAFSAGLAMADCGVAEAQNRPVEDFYGRYVGSATKADSPEVTDRDMDVVIRKGKSGKSFIVDWTTITRDGDNKLKRKRQEIEFQATARKDVYEAGMRTDKFGGRIPMDPIKGEPYVWARIQKDTLTVFALLITDEGSFEVQVYERTLTDKGLQLEFSRFRDGLQRRHITAFLEKKAN